MVQRHAAATAQLEQSEVFVVALVTAPAVWSCKAMRAAAEHNYLVAAQCYKEVPAPARVAELLLQHVLPSVLSAVAGDRAAAERAVVQELLAWLAEQDFVRDDW